MIFSMQVIQPPSPSSAPFATSQCALLFPNSLFLPRPRLMCVGVLLCRTRADFLNCIGVIHVFRSFSFDKNKSFFWQNDIKRKRDGVKFLAKLISLVPNSVTRGRWRMKVKRSALLLFNFETFLFSAITWSDYKRPLIISSVVCLTKSLKITKFCWYCFLFSLPWNHKTALKCFSFHEKDEISLITSLSTYRTFYSDCRLRKTKPVALSRNIHAHNFYAFLLSPPLSS